MSRSTNYFLQGKVLQVANDTEPISCCWIELHRYTPNGSQCALSPLLFVPCAIYDCGSGKVCSVFVCLIRLLACMALQCWFQFVLSITLGGI